MGQTLRPGTAVTQAPPLVSAISRPPHRVIDDALSYDRRLGVLSLTGAPQAITSLFFSFV
jgi:hypothetical protein